MPGQAPQRQQRTALDAKVLLDPGEQRLVLLARILDRLLQLGDRGLLSMIEPLPYRKDDMTSGWRPECVSNYVSR